MPPTAGTARSPPLRAVASPRPWAADGDGRGTWDTAFVAIPADTPDARLNAAVYGATARPRWRGEPPALVRGDTDAGEPFRDEPDAR